MDLTPNQILFTRDGRRRRFLRIEESHYPLVTLGMDGEVTGQQFNYTLTGRFYEHGPKDDPRDLILPTTPAETYRVYNAAGNRMYEIEARVNGGLADAIKWCRESGFNVPPEWEAADQHENHCNLHFPATLNTKDDHCDCALGERTAPSAITSPDIREPEFSIDPDGELAIDWLVGEHALSVSIGGTGTASYVYSTGGKTLSGTRSFGAITPLAPLSEQQVADALIENDPLTLASKWRLLNGDPITVNLCEITRIVNILAAAGSEAAPYQQTETDKAFWRGVSAKSPKEMVAAPPAKADDLTVWREGEFTSDGIFLEPCQAATATPSAKAASHEDDLSDAEPRSAAIGRKLRARGLPTVSAAPSAKPFGWVQFKNGIQTQNFARDEHELATVKSVSDSMNRDGAEITYVQVFATLPAADAGAIHTAGWQEGFRDMSQTMKTNCHFRERVFNEILELDKAEGLSRFTRIAADADAVRDARIAGMREAAEICRAQNTGPEQFHQLLGSQQCADAIRAAMAQAGEAK